MPLVNLLCHLPMPTHPWKRERRKEGKENLLELPKSNFKWGALKDLVNIMQKMGLSDKRYSERFPDYQKSHLSGRNPVSSLVLRTAPEHTQRGDRDQSCFGWAHASSAGTLNSSHLEIVALLNRLFVQIVMFLSAGWRISFSCPLESLLCTCSKKRRWSEPFEEMEEGDSCPSIGAVNTTQTLPLCIALAPCSLCSTEHSELWNDKWE